MTRRVSTVRVSLHLVIISTGAPARDISFRRQIHEIEPPVGSVPERWFIQEGTTLYLLSVTRSRVKRLWPAAVALAVAGALAGPGVSFGAKPLVVQVSGAISS